MMQKGLNIVTIIVFMMILTVPSLAYFIPLFPVIESSENRRMKEFPVFDMDSINSFPGEFDSYYADNFNGRNFLLKLNSTVSYKWFNIPPFSGKAFLGRRGWMFAIKDEMDLYMGNNLFSEDTLNRFIDVINYRKQFLDKHGCKYYLVIVPIKASVYPEYIPFAKRKTGKLTLTDQILNELKLSSDIEIIDLRTTLIESKNQGRLFHKTDNHWNELGSYYAYNSIIEKISKDFPMVQSISLSEFDVNKVKTNGRILTNMMGIMDEVNEVDIMCSPGFIKKARAGKKHKYPIPDYFPYKSKYEQVYVTNDKTMPVLLTIHDSFGNNLVPFLNEHFSKSVFIFDAWQHQLHEEIIQNEKPGIYLQMVSESLLPNIVRNAKKPR